MGASFMADKIYCTNIAVSSSANDLDVSPTPAISCSTRPAGPAPRLPSPNNGVAAGSPSTLRASRGAGAGPCPHHGCAISTCSIPARPTQGVWDHSYGAQFAADPIGSGSAMGSSMSACPHHITLQFHCRTTPDRRDLGEVAADAGTAARAIEHGAEKSWPEWEIPREAETKKWPDKAKKLHADWWEVTHRAAEGNRCIHRR